MKLVLFITLLPLTTNANDMVNNNKCMMEYMEKCPEYKKGKLTTKQALTCHSRLSKKCQNHFKKIADDDYGKNKSADEVQKEAAEANKWNKKNKAEIDRFERENKNHKGADDAAREIFNNAKIQGAYKGTQSENMNYDQFKEYMQKQK